MRQGKRTMSVGHNVDRREVASAAAANVIKLNFRGGRYAPQKFVQCLPTKEVEFELAHYGMQKVR